MRACERILRDLGRTGEAYELYGLQAHRGATYLAIYRSPCEPKTLIRAARDFERSEPLFALKAGLIALQWLCEGWGYDLDGSEVHTAFGHAMRAAEHAGQRDGAFQAMAALVAGDPVEPERGNEAWAREVLRQKVEAARRAPRG